MTKGKNTSETGLKLKALFALLIATIYIISAAGIAEAREYDDEGDNKGEGNGEDNEDNEEKEYEEEREHAEGEGKEPENEEREDRDEEDGWNFSDDFDGDYGEEYEEETTHGYVPAPVSSNAVPASNNAAPVSNNAVSASSNVQDNVQAAAQTQQNNAVQASNLPAVNLPAVNDQIEANDKAEEVSESEQPYETSNDERIDELLNQLRNLSELESEEALFNNSVYMGLAYPDEVQALPETPEKAKENFFIRLLKWLGIVKTN